MRNGVWAVGIAAIVAACGGSSPGLRGPGDLGTLSGNDVPYELADDTDLEWVREQYDAMREQDPARAPRRVELADEYARRIRARFQQDRRDDAHQSMLDLISLWSASELAAPTAPEQLARYRAELEKVRASFARAGGDRETVAALAALIVADPAGAAAYTRQIREVFEYTDDLAVAQFGDGAQRARPIEILEAVVQSFPSPFAVDELVRLYIERQRAIESHFKRNGADFQIIRAHGRGVLRTGWNILRVYARAKRIEDAPAVINGLTGFGDDADLRARLRAAMARSADAAAWIYLAAAFRTGEDPDTADLVAAFAISFEAARRFPRSAEAYLAAADDARQLGSVPLATWLYERGLALQPRSREATEHLARLYELHVGTFSENDRPQAALRALSRFEEFYRAASPRWKKQPLRPDLADAYATMGRGLLSQGRLDQARKYLAGSVQLRPTLSALESLGTLEVKLDNFREAVGYFRKALALPVEDLNFEFNRSKVLREIGEAYESSGDPTSARRYYREALKSWNDLAVKAEFRMPYLAEALVENGKLHWRLGHRGNALSLFDEAIDVDTDGASTHADVVSFLIVRNEYERALDAYHRALGSHDIGEYFKVYMSLWVVVEARRSGRTEDPLALAYLAQRDGRLWYDHLARFASGRSGAEPLASRANTRGRRAEMLYYTAVLSGDSVKMRKLLRDVLATDMVLFFEYEMAKHWLDRGSAMSKP